MVDEGSWYVVERWPHDGQPVESDHFVVYSDAADAEARQEVLEIAERKLEDAIGQMGIDPTSMVDASPDNEKIEIYAYRRYDPSAWGARAYPGGLIIWSPDHPRRQGRLNGFDATLHHELVHVIQWMIARSDGGEVPTWFIEGLPEAISGGTTGGAIRSGRRLDHLTAEYGTVVPISIRSYGQIPNPEVGEQFLYPMFQLAVEYLVDEEGLGRPMSEATEVLIDVAAGATFDEAFANHMTLSRSEYEAEFFERMAVYLPTYRNPLFAPLPFAILSLLVIGSLCLALPPTSRQATTTSAEPSPSHMFRVGVFTEIVTATAVTAGFFLGGLYTVGTLGALNNTANVPVRASAYWLLAGFLVVATGWLLLAIRRWSHRSRAALWVLPLILATMATTVLVGSLIV